MQSSYLKSFKSYLQAERGFGKNTISAYLRDTTALLRFANEHQVLIKDIDLKHLRLFTKSLHELELDANTQARVISGIRCFFRFLVLDDVLDKDPTELLEAPKLRRKLPACLSIAEIDQLVSAINYEKESATRTRAMLEILYSCGLRVSELTGLLRSCLYLDLGFVRVIGKGNKERLVPIGSQAIKHLKLYLEHTRPHYPQKDKWLDYVFLNRRGTSLSRTTVFTELKDLAESAGLITNVHPHIFRHSFATHLVQAGADLRAVQEMLGHSSITTTEIYTHLDNSQLRNTLEKFHPRF